MTLAPASLSVVSETAHLLANPHAWIDAGMRHFLAIPPQLPARLANRLILYRARLRPVGIQDLTHPDAPRLTEAWLSVPALAYLIGARCLRADIFARNGWGRLRYGAADFVALPVSFLPNSPAPTTASEADLEVEINAVGRYCIERAFDPTPVWLDRIRLRLPPANPVSPIISWELSPSFCRQLFNCASAFHRAKLH